MSSAPVPEEPGFASGFASSRPSGFAPSQPAGPGGRWSHATTLGVLQGPIRALAAMAMVWPLAQWAGRWRQGRRAAALP
jgi:hypothetical protein